MAEPFHGGDQEALPDDAEVFVVHSKTGERGVVPRSRLGSFQKAGYVLEAPEATQGAKSAEEYDTTADRALALGEGALRGATLGLSDVVLGQLDREGVDQRRNQHSGYAITGEVIGGVGGSFIPGAPAAMAAGKAAQAGAATKALVGTGKYGAAVGRYAPAIVRGGAEGALAGAGTGISNVALSADPMSAEAALAEIGTQGFIGGALGGGIGAGGQFLSGQTATARAYVKRITSPTIADDVIKAAPLSDDVAKIAKAPPKGMSRETRASLEAERDALRAKSSEMPHGWRAFDPDENILPLTSPVPKSGLPASGEIPVDAGEVRLVRLSELEKRGIFSDKPPGSNDAAHVNQITDEFSKGSGGFSRPVDGLDAAQAATKPGMPPIEVQMNPKGDLFVVDGNHRLAAALAAGDDRTIPILIASVADDVPKGASLGFGSASDANPWKKIAVARRNPGEDVIEDFKGKYHRQDTASRQQIRQIESMEKRGIQVADEVREAAEVLEQARRNMRKFLPLEPERSYESFLDGSRAGSGYAKGQGKSMQTWTAGNDEIAKAVRQPGFREALQDHQAAMDHMQGLLGNKAYPPVVGDHGVFAMPPAVQAADPAVMKQMGEVEAKFQRLESALSKDSSAAVKAKHYAETVALAERNGMSVSDEVLSAKMREAGIDGALPSDLPAEALTRLKAEIYREQAKSQLATARAAQRAKPAAKPKSALDELLGNTIAEKTATVVCTAVGGPVGGFAARMLLGNPLKKITEAVSGKIGKHAEKIGKHVDKFLSGVDKAAKVMPRTTGAILNAASYSMDDHKPTGTPFEQRSQELARAVGDEMGTKQRIHDALGGVRMADPMLGDQLEDLAWRRLQFLHDKMPKDPGIGNILNRRQKWQPSDAELSKWARIVDAAEHPEHVLESMERGTVTMEQVETMRTLYPTMFQRIQTDIVLRAGEMQRDLPWEKRLILSTMFGVPTDGVLRPESIVTLQATFVTTQPPGGGPQMPSGGQGPGRNPTKAQSLAG
jgi:hypothetical protein